MSGHSKWANIKHQKGAEDAKRGQLFTKITREIMLAVKEGGDNQDSNFRLRMAVEKARNGAMPLDNVTRAIRRAAGKEEGIVFTEVTYEGYGPGGVAIMVDTMSDNRNRTLQEIRNVFSRGGGALGENGCVSWMFQQKGVIVIPLEGKDPDEISLLAIDAGAEDVNVEGENMEVYTQPQNLEKVQAALKDKGLTITSSETSMEPQNTIELENKKAIQTVKLLEKLESMDDVQKVFSNMELTDEVVKLLEAGAD